MRLPEFISANMEDILQDFEDFARRYTGTGGEGMDVRALRDHAKGMLETIVIDLGEPQSASEQEAKSKGEAPSAEEAPDTAARLHGRDRAADAFTLNETVAEFRALRASVLRRWERLENRKRDAVDDRDQGRFHEAIDEALGESIERYAKELEHYQRAHEQDRIAEGVRRARSEFLEIVSHELRTPVHAITGYNSLLDTGVFGPLTESQQAVMARLRDATDHLAEIIEGILALRPNEENAPLEVEACTVVEALEGLESMATPIAMSHGVRIDMNLPEGGGRVLANPPKLRQILLNLITNALRSTPDGGRVWLDYQESPDEGYFRVHDTGAGIPQDHLEAIFEPFVRLDMSLTREHDGLGLGLAISRRLAHGMGGRITATSEVGAGSTFTVALRRAES